MANENFPGDAVAALRKAGHDVIWVRTESPGCRDEDVLARAHRPQFCPGHGRILRCII